MMLHVHPLITFLQKDPNAKKIPVSYWAFGVLVFAVLGGGEWSIRRYVLNLGAHLSFCFLCQQPFSRFSTSSSKPPQSSRHNSFHNHVYNPVSKQAHFFLYPEITMCLPCNLAAALTSVKKVIGLGAKRPCASSHVDISKRHKYVRNVWVCVVVQRVRPCYILPVVPSEIPLPSLALIVHSS